MRSWSWSRDVQRSKERVRRQKLATLKFEEQDLFEKFKLGVLSAAQFLELVEPVQAEREALA